MHTPNFNTYGARSGNHEVMIRGTFANVRVKNLMLPPTEDSSRIEGSFTLLNITEDETFSILGVDGEMQPRQELTLEITRKDGSVEQVPVLSRIDTPVEVEYYRHGGILPYVLRDILAKA